MISRKKQFGRQSRVDPKTGFNVIKSRVFLRRDGTRKMRPEIDVINRNTKYGNRAGKTKL